MGLSFAHRKFAGCPGAATAKRQLLPGMGQPQGPERPGPLARLRDFALPPLRHPCPRPSSGLPDDPRLPPVDPGARRAGASVCAGRRAMMNLLLVGCSFKTAPIDLREKLAFESDKLGAALQELDVRY